MFTLWWLADHIPGPTWAKSLIVAALVVTVTFIAVWFIMPAVDLKWGLSPYLG